MLAGDVEVVDVVGEVVAVAEDAAARADREMEGEAALMGVGARVHARLHDAFADGSLVEELGQMADGVVHQSLLRMLHAFGIRFLTIGLSGQRGLDGVVDVEVVDGFVDGLALALDAVQIFDDVARRGFRRRWRSRARR